MGIVADIFSVLGEIFSGVADMFVAMFSGVVSLFYTAGTGSESGSFTVIGVLMLVTVAIGLFWLSFNFLRNLIKLRG